LQLLISSRQSETTDKKTVPHKRNDNDTLWVCSNYLTKLSAKVKCRPLQNLYKTFKYDLTKFSLHQPRFSHHLLSYNALRTNYLFDDLAKSADAASKHVYNIEKSKHYIKAAWERRVRENGFKNWKIVVAASGAFAKKALA